jgi:hypothetical protein
VSLRTCYNCRGSALAPSPESASQQAAHPNWEWRDSVRHHHRPKKDLVIHLPDEMADRVTPLLGGTTTLLFPHSLKVQERDIIALRFHVRGAAIHADGQRVRPGGDGCFVATIR